MNTISNKTQLSLTIKDFAGLALVIASIIGMYFALQADIVLAKELPKPTITQEEFKYKDELIRASILHTQQDIGTVKSDISEIKGSLKVLEERLYELKKK